MKHWLSLAVMVLFASFKLSLASVRVIARSYPHLLKKTGHSVLFYIIILANCVHIQLLLICVSCVLFFVVIYLIPLQFYLYVPICFNVF